MTNREYVQGLIGKAVERINEGVSKTLTARLQSETPPLDSRHLTDTRTRVSTLLEYALSYELNHLLIEEGKGRSASAVLWNVFPDLIVRDACRAPFIGLEVKALHTAAEEKSANLSTPLHVIKRGTDFVVIIIWAWRREGASITYSHIHAAGVFDAYLLAQIRDYSWLFKKGKQRKGIDISTPIITPKKKPTSHRYKAEDKNIGKLLRITLAAKLPASTPRLAEMQAEAELYEQFKAQALTLGLTETFREICDLQRATHVKCRSLDEYPKMLTQIGRAKLSGQRRIYLFAGGNSKSAACQKLDSVAHPAGTIAFWLGSKLKWTVFKVVEGSWKQVATGTKPDTAYEKIQAAIGN
jgi:hypothetical protein